MLRWLVGQGAREEQLQAVLSAVEGARGGQLQGLQGQELSSGGYPWAGGYGGGGSGGPGRGAGLMQAL